MSRKKAMKIHQKPHHLINEKGDAKITIMPPKKPGLAQDKINPKDKEGRWIRVCEVVDAHGVTGFRKGQHVTLFHLPRDAPSMEHNGEKWTMARIEKEPVAAKPPKEPKAPKAPKEPKVAKEPKAPKQPKEKKAPKEKAKKAEPTADAPATSEATATGEQDQATLDMTNPDVLDKLGQGDKVEAPVAAATTNAKHAKVKGHKALKKELKKSE